MITVYKNTTRHRDWPTTTTWLTYIISKSTGSISIKLDDSLHKYKGCDWSKTI